MVIHMEIIQLVLALITLGLLYIRMIKREIPEPISKPQAAIPVVLGVVSVPVSFLIFLALGTLLMTTGYSKNEVPMVVSSVVGAFFGAGFPEEIAKLAMMVRAWDDPKNENGAFRREVGTLCFSGVGTHWICLLFCKEIPAALRRFSQVYLHLLCLLFSQLAFFPLSASQKSVANPDFLPKLLTRTFVSDILSTSK